MNKGMKKEDKRRTRSGDRLVAGAELHTRRRTRRGQQEDNARTRPITGAAKDCGQLLFCPKREPQQQPLGIKNSFVEST